MKHWKKLYISPRKSILSAIEILDSGSTKILVVVDENERLLGTITDGDIRRGILRGVRLNEPISGIMNAHPRTARADEKSHEILSRMKTESLRQMPVVDREGIVTGVEVLDELVRPSVKENWVVLMAGGLGTRLRPLTEDCPKPLLRVGKKPILETTIESFVEHGFKSFFLCVRYLEKKVMDHFQDGSQWGISIQYLCEKEPLGTAGALSLLPGKPAQPLVMMNGDLLTNVNFHQLLDFHHEHDAQATMCVKEYGLQVPFGVIQLDKHRIHTVDEKPVHRFFVNAGIYVLSPSLLSRIPHNAFLDMPNFFNQLVHDREMTAAFPIREYWLDVGRVDDLKRAHNEYASIFE